MSIADRCEREIHELHDFFVGWLGGDLPDDAETFERVASVLAEEFEITSPSGETQDREAILDSLRKGHGSGAGADPPFDIRIADVRPRFEMDDHCLLTYEEHQQSGGGGTARVSTVLFRAADPDRTPNGVEWVHLQETWLPDGDPER